MIGIQGSRRKGVPTRLAGRNPLGSETSSARKGASIRDERVRSDPVTGVGAIAQLGERLLCKQEVVGSIPSGSTSREASSSVIYRFASPQGPSALRRRRCLTS
jgi:hypothetical protein